MLSIARRAIARTRLAVRRIRGKSERPGLQYEAALGRSARREPLSDGECLVRFGPQETDVYAKIQSYKSARQSGVQWFIPKNLEEIGRLILSLGPNPSFGICHGAKHGRECEVLASATGATVIGTDISEHVRGLPRMVVWDFQEPNPEWTDRADFIYSNSWDHSRDPAKTFRVWAETLRPGGLLIFDHSRGHEPGAQDPADPYRATREALKRRVLSSAAVEHVTDHPLPERGDVAIIFRR